jgi:hypothetical protein
MFSTSNYRLLTVWHLYLNLASFCSDYGAVCYVSEVRSVQLVLFLQAILFSQPIS